MNNIKTNNFWSENYTMLFDFYELTMGNGYFQAGYQDRITYFDLFFRDVPDKGGFAVCAGLDQIIDYILDLQKRLGRLHSFAPDGSYLQACMYKRNALAAGAALNYISRFIESV